MFDIIYMHFLINFLNLNLKQNKFCVQNKFENRLISFLKEADLRQYILLYSKD